MSIQPNLSGHSVAHIQDVDALRYWTISIRLGVVPTPKTILAGPF